MKQILKQFLKDVMAAQSCYPVLACYTHGRCWSHIMWRPLSDPVWKTVAGYKPDYEETETKEPK